MCRQCCVRACRRAGALHAVVLSTCVLCVCVCLFVSPAKKGDDCICASTACLPTTGTCHLSAFSDLWAAEAQPRRWARCSVVSATRWGRETCLAIRKPGSSAWMLTCLGLQGTVSLSYVSCSHFLTLGAGWEQSQQLRPHFSVSFSHHLHLPVFLVSVCW